MLHEFEQVRQVPGGYRRFFTDSSFDLYVWFGGDRKEILGFQLVYNKDADEKALTWDRGEGFIHSGVETGDTDWYKPTPILVQDGLFDWKSVYRSFRDASLKVDAAIRKLVLEKMREYGTA